MRRHAAALRPLVLATAVTAVAVATVLSACGGSGSGGSGPRRYVVEMTAFTFQPETLLVSVGDTIVWVNRDAVPHTATARNRAWDSGMVDTYESWIHVADERGGTPYTCALHPSMRGVLTVQ